MNRLIRIVVMSGLLIMLAIGLAFAERDAPTQTQLIGRWESTTPPSMITFTPDGIMYIEGNYGKFFCYTATNKEIIIKPRTYKQLLPLEPIQSVAFPMTINETSLTTAIEGEQRTYTRINSSGDLTPDGEMFVRFLGLNNHTVAEACPK